jgi:hypothetical protein
MKKMTIMTTLVLLFAICAANANVVYVNANSTNNPGLGSQGDPYLEIQIAINAAEESDTIIIAQVIYSGENNCDLNLLNLKATTTSTAAPIQYFPYS